MRTTSEDLGPSLMPQVSDRRWCRSPWTSIRAPGWTCGGPKGCWRAHFGDEGVGDRVKVWVAARAGAATPTTTAMPASAARRAIRRA